MLKFIISSFADHGKLISGKLEEGTLKKGGKIYLYETNGTYVQECTVDILYNSGKPVNSFSSTDVARHFKFTVKEKTLTFKAGQQFKGEKPSSNSGFTFNPANFNPQDLAGTFVKVESKPTFTIPVIQPTPTTHIWNSNTYNEFGISLQGGGLKGAFGVGALKYLQVAGILDGQKKIHLASASTGSITSVMLAENSPQSIDKAIKQYSELRQVEDMFVLKQKVIDILKTEPSLKKIVLGLVKSGGDTSKIEFDAKEFGKDKVKRAFKTTLNDSLSNPLSMKGFAPLAGANFLNNLVDETSKTWKSLKLLAKVDLNLAELDPVKAKLLGPYGVDQTLLAQRINSKNVTLKMAVTSLETGATCYITENLELLYPKKGIIGDGSDYHNFDVCKISHIDNNSVGTTSAERHKKGLVLGALASGAFPALFRPLTITFIDANGVEDTQLFNDGGIRENLPIDILGRVNTKNIIAIYCSQIDENHEEDVNPSSYTWGDVVMRSMSFIESENARNDISSGNPMNTFLQGDGDHNVLHIAPTTGTLGLAEIQPFNIKTTIWYGYLRAYDEVFLSDNKSALGADFQHVKGKLRENTENIYICMRSIGTYGAKLVSTSAFRVPVKEGATSGDHEYAMFNPAAQGLKRRALSNFDKTISVIAFDYTTLYGYLHLKNELLGLLIDRHELVARDPKNAQAFMAGEFGFLKKAILCDWFGLYEHLDHIRIAANKRTRLTMAFRKYSPLDENFLPNLVDKTIFGYENQKVPKRISRGTHRDFFQLTGEIRGRIQTLEQKGVPFEGKMTDKLVDDTVILFSSDNDMVSKDTSFYAS